MPRTHKYPVPRPSRTAPEHRAEPNVFDPVFFHKSRVKVGTRFRYFGRMDPGTLWEVVAIHTHTRIAGGKRKGQYNRKAIQRCQRLHDDVTFRCITAGREAQPTRTCAFSGLSYSAIWRLA